MVPPISLHPQLVILHSAESNGAGKTSKEITAQTPQAPNEQVIES